MQTRSATLLQMIRTDGSKGNMQARSATRKPGACHVRAAPCWPQGQVLGRAARELRAGFPLRPAGVVRAADELGRREADSPAPAGRRRGRTTIASGCGYSKQGPRQRYVRQRPSKSNSGRARHCSSSGQSPQVGQCQCSAGHTDAGGHWHQRLWVRLGLP
jgi:hypothetical protein